MMVKSQMACPKEKRLRQRENTFKGVVSSDLIRLLKDAENENVA